MAASFFAISNVLAGLLHYLFQVFASKQLSASDFAIFSVWFAQVSVLCMAGGLLQYAGNFYPATNKVAIRSIQISILGCFALISAWILFPSELNLTRGLLIVVSAGCFGWISGLIQQRMFFIFLGTLNLAMAGFKLLMIFIPLEFLTDGLARFSFAVLAGYGPALLLVYILLWNKKSFTEVPVHSLRRVGANVWAAPIILSLAGALIPQMDIIILKNWTPTEVFEDFVRVSLFYKGIYFFMFILAQWMLPKQISRTEHKTTNPIFSFQLGLAALVGSAAVTLAAPLIETWILRWDSLPPSSMVFYTCLNMSLLTWFFLLIQEACARNKLKIASVALAGVVGNLGLQSLLRWPVEAYFQLAICIHLTILVSMIYALKPNQRK